MSWAGDLVVANAGVMLGVPFHEADTSEWDRMTDVNLRASLGPRGVRVRSIDPAFAVTELGADTAHDATRDGLDTMRSTMETITAEDVADAITYSVSLPARARRGDGERVGPGLLRLMDGWDHVPVLVLGYRMDVLAVNRLSRALHARMFAASGLRQDDPGLTALVGQLSVHSDEVGELNLGYDSLTGRQVPVRSAKRRSRIRQVTRPATLDSVLGGCDGPSLNLGSGLSVEIMTDEQLIADLHRRWVFGWERAEGDTPFDFRRTFGEFYDFSSPDVRLYDDFDPEQRVATTAAGYGSIWEPNFRTMVSAQHAVDDGPHVIAGHDLAASTLRFAARITMPDSAMDLRTTTSLVWRRTPDGWRIVREHNSTKILPAGDLDGRFGDG